MTACTVSGIVPGRRKPHGGCATDRALGARAKTGSRLAAKLAKLGLNVRTAARHGGDVHFEWDDAAPYRPALRCIDRLCLAAPVMRTDFADPVATFLARRTAHAWT